MPAEWIDRDTGHKITRLTGPEGDSRSFNFHNNPFIPGARGKADRMIYYGQVPKGTDDKDFTPRGGQQLFSMNLEPNVHFSPDGKLVIFRANFEGSSQIYAVEVAKTRIKGRKSKG